MKKQVEDWVFLAEKDIRAASVIIDEPYLTNIVAYHCQQAIEKYFKAFLLNNDVPIIKTHDLLKLNGMITDVRDLGFDEDKLSIGHL